MKKLTTRKSLRTVTTGFCLFFTFLQYEAHAFTGNTWDPQGTAGGVPTNGNWEDISWSQSTTEAAQSPTSAFVEGQAACFAVGDAAGRATALTITMNSGHSVAGIFNGPLAPPSCALTINGPGVMTISPAGLQGFNDGGTTPGTTVINAQIAGPATLTPEGAGQLTLNGTNTYTGGTALGFSGGSFTGTVFFNNNSSFGTGTIIVSNASGGTLSCSAASAITIPNSVSWQQASANLAFVGTVAGVTFSGPWSLATTANIFASNSTSSSVIISGPISGAGGINKAGLAILKLTGTNSYTGATVVSNGVFALGATGSINNTPSITLSPGPNGSVFDVSAISAYTLSGSTTLFARGTGTGTTAEAAMKGASGGSISLGSRPINLTFTPTAFTGDTAHSPLFISQGALTLNNNTITVTITNATTNALGVGTYRLIQVGNGTTGTINGTPNLTPVIAGTGLVTNTAAILAVSNGNVNLVVRNVASFSPLSISQSNTFAVGATSVTLSGQIGAGAVHPALNETVNVNINGTLKTTTTKDANGNFSVTFDPSAIPYSPTNYAIILSYGGDTLLSSTTNTNNLAAKVLFVDDSLPNFFSGLNLICTNTAGIAMYTWSTTNPGLPVTDWTLEGAMEEQPLNDGSGKSRYSININPAAALVYYISGPTNGWPYHSPDGVQWVTNDFAGDYGVFPTNIAISAAGVLAFPLPPTIVTPPTNLAVVAGKNATFNVTVTGSRPMNYQWFFNTNTPVSNLTNSPLILTNASTNQAGTYSVFVTNQYGSTNSDYVTLTVLPPPTLIPQLTSNGFQLSGTLGAGETYWVQSATNLSPPVQWKTIATNAADTNGLALFSVTNITGDPGLFYRLVIP